jgi:hypothetical protein
MNLTFREKRDLIFLLFLDFIKYILNQIFHELDVYRKKYIEYLVEFWPH